MLRMIGGAVAGVIAWVVIVTILNFGLRYGMTGYAAVEKAMLFTVPMMIARLSISAISSLASGGVAAWIGKDRLTPALIAGIVLLLLFIPVHISIWTKFPIWYHLTFLTSLPVFSMLGGRLARRRASALSQAAF